ncbi:MAG TPA: ADOP family duplicated permease [Acidobacteriaceae bacterium]|nr:ADOP family duplicated permease [Acidobacteriaceae bacterium]
MSFLRDLRIAIRSLSRVRALWITVALTLALGIGANAAIFSVVRAVLLRPLANRDENRLLYLRQSAPGLGDADLTFSIPEIHDLGQNLKTISELGTFSEIDFTMVGLGTPREIPAGVVDGHYFEVMGLRPVLGRLLGPGDDGPNAQGAVVLTYKFWKSSLHSDPDVLGKTVRLDGGQGSRNATIVGVLEPSIPYPVATEIIANVVTSPHHLSATMVQGREHRMTEVFARLAPGATLEQARAELGARYASILAAHPDVYKTSDHFEINVTRMHDQINARANTILWVLFGASGLLFVIACSNVANLVLARTVRREPELAVRTALGASAPALRRSLLAEGLVLCGSGVLAALLLAWPMVEILGRYAARFSVRADGLTLDLSLVWFGIALALAAAVFLAYIPRLPGADATQGLGLAAGGTRVTSGSNRRLRIFAVTQITASFLLLVGAGVLMRTLYVLESTRPPFDTRDVLAVNLPVMTYGRSPEQVQDFYHQIEERVSAIPGVQAVSTGFMVPWRDEQAFSINFAFAVDGAKRTNGQDDLRARWRSVSPGYFNTLGVPILEGRDFRDLDRDGTDRVVIVSKSLADKLFPGQEAIGRQMRWTDPVMKFIGISYEPRRIVGVVPDFDDEHIIPDPGITIYQPVDQEGWNGRMFVRTSGNPYALVTPITKTIHGMDVEQPVERAATLEDIRAEVLTPDKLNAVVFGGFAAVALLISVVGVAGVLAFSVSARTREFGIRVAMGAQPKDILTGVLREGLVIATVGVTAGLVLGFAGTRVLERFVTDVHMPGIVMFVASGLVILAAAVIAAAVPAARAASVNAVEALRAD